MPRLPPPLERRDAVAAAALAAFAMAYFASFAPWNRPVLLDAATWDWMATEVARGMIPYRDVFLHKTPGSALVGAAGVAAGRALGIEPVLAAHALYLLLGTAGAVLLFLLCRTRLPLGVSLAAGVALLAYDEWPIAALEGCRPKVPTTVFGVASLLAAERGAAFRASLLGGASVLCWQPGVAFLFGAWAATWRRGERRPGRILAIGAASLVPAALLLGWLAANGALRDFWEQAVQFNLHYIDEKARTPIGTLRAFARTIGAWNDVEMLLAPAAVAGLLLRPKGELRLPVSLAVFGAIYLAMTFVSYQSWPDAILLGPPVAALLATGLWSLFSSRLDARAASAGVLLALALATLPDEKAKFHPPIGFDEQRRRFGQLAADLAPDDRVVAVSVPEFFLHTGRRNGWKWPYFWFGVDDFAAREAGGFDAILADLERDPPAAILVARLWAGPQRQLFEEWTRGRYEARTLRLFPHTKRPLKVYRRIPR